MERRAVQLGIGLAQAAVILYLFLRLLDSSYHARSFAWGALGALVVHAGFALVSARKGAGWALMILGPQLSYLNLFSRRFSLPLEMWGQSLFGSFVSVAPALIAVILWIRTPPGIPAPSARLRELAFAALATLLLGFAVVRHQMVETPMAWSDAGAFILRHGADRALVMVGIILVGRRRFEGWLLYLLATLLGRIPLSPGHSPTGHLLARYGSHDLVVVANLGVLLALLFVAQWLAGSRWAGERFGLRDSAPAHAV